MLRSARSVGGLAGVAALLLLGSFLALLLPARAGAARPLETALLASSTFSGPDAGLAFARTHDAGARAIRLYLDWRRTAPSGATKPSGFDPSNPADLAYTWQAFDLLVRLARANGLMPIADIVDAPQWAQGPGNGVAGTIRPDPVELARFAHAAAVRYDGAFQGLPRVSAWQVWNEPNHFLFLNPQIDGGAITSPDLYRRMVNAVADAVHGVNSGNLVVAVGLSPFTNNVAGQFVTGPLLFMRDLLCMSTARRVKPGCRERIRFDVWSHHPYTSGGPTHHAARPDDVSLGDLPKMRRLLSGAVHARHVISHRRVRFWVTEFSWDSNPPDPNGVPTRLHARWVAEALYRMWRAGVSLVTWFQFRDDAARGRPDGQVFQSGLYSRCNAGLSCDRPKPALKAFRFPFVAFRAGRRISFWGRTPGGTRAKVIVEQSSGRRWRRVASVSSNRYGIFARQIRTSRHGALRAHLTRGNARSLPFSLKRPPDRRVNPFG
jgi:hypothetical protein